MQKENFKESSNIIHYLLILFTIIIAVIVRFWALGDKSIYGDQLFSYLLVSKMETFWDSFVFMLIDLSPPLYYLILYFWTKLFGYTEFAMRFPSALIVVLSVPLVYVATKKLFNKNVALSAMILTAFSPILLLISQIVRGYSFYLFFSIFTLYYWIKLINEMKEGYPEKSTLNKYVLFSLITIFLHYLGSILIFLQGLYLLYIAYSKKRGIKDILEAGGKILLVFGSFFAFHYSFLGKLSSVFDSDRDKIFYSDQTIEVLKYIFYDSNYFLGIILLLLLSNIRQIKNFVVNDIKEKSWASPIIYFSYIIAFSVILLCSLDSVSIYVRPIHIIFVIPCAYTLISCIVHGAFVKNAVLKNFIVFVIAGLFLCLYIFIPMETSSGKKVTFYKYDYQELKSSTDYILENADKDTMVLINNRDSRLYYRYYIDKPYKENAGNLNLDLELNLFSLHSLESKIKKYRSTYPKIFIYASPINKDDIKWYNGTINSAKPLCPSLERKNFTGVILFECSQ